MNHRLLMVSKMDAANAEAVAAILGEHDKTDLPHQVGLRARTLLHYQGMMFHLIESDHNILDNVVRVHEDNTEFQELSVRLRPYLSPLVSNWHSVADSQAREFYHTNWQPE
jgi:hypothetical protein